MNKTELKTEHLLYFFAFLLAISLRLVNLGLFPLSDREAILALESLNVSNGSGAKFLDAPLVILLNGFLFYVFESNEFVGRILQAILGSFVVFVPLIFRKNSTAKASIILAFGLALDPILISLSKQINGMQWTIVCLLLSLLLVVNKKIIFSGIFFGLTVLSGTGFWKFVVFLLGLIVLLRLVDKENFDVIKIISKKIPVKKLLISSLLTIITIGTLFGVVPHGISGIFSSFDAFIDGWSGDYEVSLFLLIGTLFVYELLPIIFATFGFIRKNSTRSNLNNVLFIGLLCGLFLAFIYPERQIYDLAWAVIILWVFAADQIDKTMDYIRSQTNWIIILIEAIIIAVLGIFASINVASIQNNLYSTSDVQLRIIVFIVSLVMMGVVALLVYWGWAKDIAISGIIVGLFSVFLCYSIFNTFHVSSIGKPAYNELVYIGDSFPDADLFFSTLEDFSEWSTGNQTEIDIVVVELDNAVIEWTLRNYINTQYVNYIPLDVSPSIIISPEKHTLNLSSEYTGQDFVIAQVSDFAGTSFRDITNWFFYRDVKSQSREVILWVTTDLFPGSEEQETELIIEEDVF